eukprot:106968_1
MGHDTMTIIFQLMSIWFIQINYGMLHSSINCTQKSIGDFIDSLELIQQPIHLLFAVQTVNQIGIVECCTSYQTKSTMNKFYTTIIAQYARLKQFQSFKDTFHLIAKQTQNTNILDKIFWNTFFKVYFMNENQYVQFPDFIAFFMQMRIRIVPDIQTFNIIIYGVNANKIIINLGKTELFTTHLIHKLMPQYQIAPNLETFQLLQDTHCEINNISHSNYNKQLLSLIDKYS